MAETTTALHVDTTHDGVAHKSPVEDDVLRLFESHGQSLFRLCRALALTSADAEDIVQNAFLKLLQHLGADRDRSNLRAWLFTVVTNECRSRARWRRRWLPWRAELDTRAVAAVQDVGWPDADEAFRGLSGRDRQLLALRAEGCSYREIALATGIRPQSVGRLLARAIARWKRALPSELNASTRS